MGQLLKLEIIFTIKVHQIFRILDIKRGKHRHKEIHKVYPRVDIWLKDSASASRACGVDDDGVADLYYASGVLRVCPLFLIA